MLLSALSAADFFIARRMERVNDFIHQVRIVHCANRHRVADFVT